MHHGQIFNNIRKKVNTDIDFMPWKKNFLKGKNYSNYSHSYELLVIVSKYHSRKNDYMRHYICVRLTVLYIY